MKKLFIALFLGALLLVGCSDNDDEINLTPNVTFNGDEEELQELAAALSLPNNTITIPYDPDIAPSLGQGYLSMTENFKLTCFTDETREEEVKDGNTFTPGQVTTNFHFNMAESMQELLKTMEVNTSASVGFGLFKTHAAFNFLKELNINTHTIVAVSKYEILGKTLTFKGDPKTDFPQTFSEENAYGLCGDYYAHSIRAGGKLYAVITIETSSSEEKNKIEAELKASFGSIVDVEGNTKKEFKEKLEEYHATIDVVAIGCKPIPPVRNWEEYLAVLNTFEQDVTSCLDEPYAFPVTVTLWEADTVYMAEGYNPENLDAQRDAFKKLINFYIEYDQLLADLEHFRTYIATYDVESLYTSRDAALAQIDSTEDKIENELAVKIEAQIEYCQKNPYNCEFLSDPELPESEHPDNLRYDVIPAISFYPESCDDLLDNGDGFLLEGEYTLYFRGLKRYPFQAYCTNMDPYITSEPPKTYLTLLDPNDNYAQFKGLWQYRKCTNIRDILSKKNCNLYWPDLKSNYGKVRIDVEQDAIYIDVLDNAFAANEGGGTKAYPFFCKDLGNKEAFTYVPYGIGFRSNSSNMLPSHEPADPVTFIDLRGTKFKIAHDESWSAMGHNLKTYSRATIDPNRQIVSLQVMGNIAKICPSNYPRIKLEYCIECY